MEAMSLRAQVPQALGYHPLFEASPECEGQKAGQDVGVHAGFEVMVEGAQSEIAFGGAERGFGCDEPSRREARGKGCRRQDKARLSGSEEANWRVSMARSFSARAVLR